MSLIYLDYAATTPVDPQVAATMWSYLMPDGDFGNPASSHVYGRKAALAVEVARQQVADLICADAHEIIWTSGATEANNLAIKGIAQFYRDKGRHIITCVTEHEAVIETCKYLENEGFEVTYLQPQSSGLITVAQLAAAICADTILVSIMHVNNEIGVIQDIQSLGNFLREKKIYFHVDAAQSVGKIPIDLTHLPVDMMSFSAHKIYGPKGIGALYIRQKSQIQLKAQLHGGGQERGLRAGTLATHQIVGMGAAFALAQEKLQTEAARILFLKQKFWHGMKALGDVFINGDVDQCVPGILNVAFAGIDAATLLPALKDLAVSMGSACHSASGAPSRVLHALGISADLAQGSIRFSLGRFTTEEEIDFAVNKIQTVVKTLRVL